MASALLTPLLPACGRGSTPGSPAPQATLTALPGTPSGVQRSVITIGYTLSDVAALTCTLAVAFSVDGGTTFQPATPGPGGDGTSNLSSSPNGTARVVVWNSLPDGAGLTGPGRTGPRGI